MPRVATAPTTTTASAPVPAPTAPAAATSPRWLESLRDAYAIHNVVGLRPELPFYVLRWDGERNIEWMELGDPRQRLRPFHFEIHFGKEAMRDEHYLAALDEASRSGRLVQRNLFGFSDLFYPIGAERRARPFLYAGQFYQNEPTWEGVCEQWRALTGHAPASANPDFVHFVRMALGLPILPEALAPVLEEFLGLWAQQLTRGAGQPGGDLREQIDRLNREGFSRQWAIHDWVDSAIHPDKFHLTPWSLEGGLPDWLKEGLGIEQLPTTVMTLMPLDPRSAVLDPVQTLVRNRQIQRALINFAREMPETAATPLEDYGVSFITSTKPGKNAAKARVELRERAQAMQEFVRERFAVRSVVGIGPTLARGARLNPSHMEAVLALHMCVQLDRDVLFFDEHGGGELVRYAALQRAAGRLLEALERESATETKAAADGYVQLVLRFSAERIEVARGQFLATLFQLFAAVQRRYPTSHEARDRFAEDLTGRLEEAHSLSQVIEEFKDALGRLGLVSSRAWHGPNVMRLQATLQYLRENFAENLPLPSVARKAGFSVPAFSRVFKQATGTSFLAYLRTIRVEHAKRLLTTTRLTTDQIAQASGFQSQHHLIRSFKKVTGQTPGACRRAARAE
jgi:AraC-like DNA-binding protein